MKVLMRRARHRLAMMRDDCSFEEQPSKKSKHDTAEQNLHGFAMRKWAAGTPFSDCDFATMAHFHTQSGGQGLAEYAKNPQSRGRNQARTVRGALGVGDIRDQVAVVKTKVWDWRNNRQKDARIHMRLPQDILRRHYDPKTWLTKNLDPDLWDVPAFTTHPICLANGTDNTIGIGLYSDKVKLSRTDVFLRMSIGAVWMRKKFTMVAIPSFRFCQCGCNGRCTLDPLQVVINSCVNALQDGKEPDICRPFQIENEVRAARANKPLPYRIAACEYRGDWPEKADVSGYKTHQATVFCAKCFCQKGHYLGGVQNCSLNHLVWTRRSSESYPHELATHIVPVHLPDSASRDQLLSVISYRRGSLWGRRVNTNALGAPFGLQRNDALICPGGPLFFLADLDTVVTPCRVFFFRPRTSSGIAKTSLLWDTPPLHAYGIKFFGPHAFVEDMMHNGSLGYEGRYTGEVLGRALNADVFETGCRLQEDRIEAGVLVLRDELDKYYARAAIHDPDHPLSTIKRITSGMLGNLDFPFLNAHAGEVKSLVMFCQELTDRFPDVRGFKLLSRSGKALLEYNEICKTESRKLPIKKQQQLWEACLTHLKAYELAEGHVIPKHHAMVHQTLDAGYFGNPAFGATWQDEHENGVIGRAGQTAHLATFSKTIFQKIIAVEQFGLDNEVQIS